MFSFVKARHVSEADTAYGPEEASARGPRTRNSTRRQMRSFEKSRLTVALQIHPIAWYQTVLTHTLTLLFLLSFLDRFVHTFSSLNLDIGKYSKLYSSTNIGNAK